MASKEIKFDVKLNADGSAKTLNQLKEDAKKFNEEIANVEPNSDKFTTLKEKINETNGAIKEITQSMSEVPTQSLTEAFLDMGQLAAGGFAVAKGAMAALGTKSEELGKIQTQVQGAIAIAVGMRQVKEAALTVWMNRKNTAEKAGLILTKANVIATKLATAAMKMFGGSLATTTKGFKALKFAIVSTGIGALVVGVGMLVSKIMEWTSATDDQANAQEILNAKIKASQEGLNKTLTQRDILEQINQRNMKARTDQEKELAEVENELAIATYGASVQLAEINKAIAAGQKPMSSTTKMYEEQANKVKELERTLIILRQTHADSNKRRSEEESAAKTRDSEKQQRIRQEAKEVEELARLRNEIALLEEENDNERARMKIEQDRQNALSSIGEHHNKVEMIQAINEKFDEQERQRQDEVDQAEKDRKQGIVDFINEKDEELRTAKQETGLAEMDEGFAKQEFEINQKMENALRQQEAQMEIDLAELDQMNATEDEKQKIRDHYAAMEIETRSQTASEHEALEEAKAEATKTSNLEMAAAVGQLAGALSSLAGDNKELAAASAIIDTYVSANKALASSPPPLSYVLAAASIVQGMASVKKIYATKVGKGDKGNKGGGAATPTPPRVVTGKFQVSGLEEPEPVKAYVVTDEMTDSQDQLENIRNRSTI